MDYLEGTSFESSLDSEQAVATLSSSLIYGSEQSASQWLSLTQDDEYPYYRIEMDQLNQLLQNRSLSDLEETCRMVCIGAADSKKEMAIARFIAQSEKQLEITLVDSSPALLDHALLKFAALKLMNAGGVFLDARNSDSFHSAIGDDKLVYGKPRLFTAFGNIVGNYQGLSMVTSLHGVMHAGDRLIFGAHLKSRCAIGPYYPPYHSKAYYDHMASALHDAGVDITLGSFATEVKETKENLVDVIEIYFDLDKKTKVLSIHPNASEQAFCISRILVDVSCKYSMRFLQTELRNLGWRESKLWISECKSNVIFLCKK